MFKSLCVAAILLAPSTAMASQQWQLLHPNYVAPKKPEPMTQDQRDLLECMASTQSAEAAGACYLLKKDARAHSWW